MVWRQWSAIKLIENKSVLPREWARSLNWRKYPVTHRQVFEHLYFDDILYSYLDLDRIYIDAITEVSYRIMCGRNGPVYITDIRENEVENSVTKASHRHLSFSY